MKFVENEQWLKSPSDRPLDPFDGSWITISQCVDGTWKAYWWEAYDDEKCMGIGEGVTPFEALKTLVANVEGGDSK